MSPASVVAPSPPRSPDLLARGGRGEAGAVLETRRDTLSARARRELPANLQGRLDPDDLVQEALAAAWASIASFHGDSERDLEVWLSAILTNAIRDARRAHRSRKRDCAREVSLETAVVTTERAPTGADPLIAAEEAAQVRQCLEELPESHQRVLRLREYDELPFRQVAERLGISEDAAKKLHARALRALKRLLRGRGVWGRGGVNWRSHCVASFG